MATLAIEDAALSPNPVSAGGQLKITVDVFPAPIALITLAGDDVIDLSGDCILALEPVIVPLAAMDGSNLVTMSGDNIGLID